MRGTPAHRQRKGHPRGIIPAHAGNTRHCARHEGKTRDHPRACGEHPATPATAGTAPGSSPRMRGTPVGSQGVETSPGIIPAHAGNTRLPDASGMTGRDHPRACGEHALIGSRRHRPSGSSPRMRGTLVEHMHIGPVRGIIPAHAGNTQLATEVSAQPWDHPRACGEHSLCVLSVAESSGSSPRMRGTLVLE